MAAGFISMFIDTANTTHINSLKDDPEKMWKKLDGIHNAKTPVMRFNAMDILFNVQKESEEDLQALMTRAKAAMDYFKALIPTDGSYTLETFQEELVVMTLLCALPKDFRHI